jgi:hypothetical protein
VFPPASAPVLEDGWHAPEYGRKLPAPVVSIVVENVRHADFITLVVPLDAGTQAPRLTVRSAADPVVVEVATPEHRDVVTWNRWNAWWRRSGPDGEPLSFRACAAGEGAA